MDRQYFGTYLDLLRGSVRNGGSELGLGLTLFALTASIRAETVVETGRYKGFSALALAGALKLLDEPGWREPDEFFGGRPNMDYRAIRTPRKRQLFSIDPYPDPEAESLLSRAGLLDYVHFINESSLTAQLPADTPALDIAFIDGDHGYEACMADVDKFTPMLRSGGLFVLHDYFGWYDHNGNNGSPIKQVLDNITQSRFKQFVLIDTYFPSFMILRKP